MASKRSVANNNSISSGPASGTRVRPRPVPVLTSDLHTRLSGWNRSDAQNRVAIGKLLKEAKAQMAHGEWLAWLEREMPFRPRSAQLFMELSDWADQNPGRFEQLAPLGPSKLYILFKLAKNRLAGLLNKADHRVPSINARLPLSKLTFHQFLEVLEGDQKPTEEEAADAYAQKLMKKSKSDVSAVRQAIQNMIAHRDILPEDDVEDMYDTLQEALGWLANAFAIPD